MLNKYYRAVGFSELDSYQYLAELSANIIAAPDDVSSFCLPNGETYREFRKEFAEDLGLIVCAIITLNNSLMIERVSPYFIGSEVSSYESVSIDRNFEKFSFSGICDEAKLDISLIFTLLDCVSYLNRIAYLPENAEISSEGLILTALSCEGSVLLALSKDEEQLRRNTTDSRSRLDLIFAARNGDEKAQEDLELRDLDAFAHVARRVVTEDIFSVVDTYFMPHGVESDQYSILAEILDFHMEINSMTRENIYIMRVSCNDLVFDVCINELDLVGEPDIGRRFKGIVWIQGQMCFSDEI